MVADEDVVKVHIHTDHPGQVLEFCGLGELTSMKIDNMPSRTRRLSTMRRPTTSITALATRW